MKQIALSIFAGALIIARYLDPTPSPVDFGYFVDACIITGSFLYVIFSDYQ